MRLAWFSPLPPVRTGIATVSAELVRALGAEHEIDVFVDEPVVAAYRSPELATESRLENSPEPLTGAHSVRSAHDFVWRQRQAPYDLSVYQLGNSSHHDYLWPYLFRYPGLAVLHDAHLHHARAAALLRQRRADDYRAEFAANQPGVSADAAELAIAGFHSHLHYQWPFTRLIVSASRVTAVHSRAVRDELRADLPDATIEYIRLGHGAPLAASVVGDRRAMARDKYRIAQDAVVFGCFGGLTPEKRIPQILSAFEATLHWAPAAILMLVGSPAEHYDAAADVARRRLRDRVVMTGYVEREQELTDCIAACDVTLNLRWPTAREISGPWLRCLAAGTATIIIDLAHTADVPAVDPRTWTNTASDRTAPVAVAIDIMDEDHSLRLAMRRLAVDGALRETLGAAGRAYWHTAHSHAAMLEDYRRLIPIAAHTAVPDSPLPPHTTDDESGVMTSILSEFGVPVPWSKI
jgi:glycosyltransferase involved in cell wall biosynthesis